MKEAFGVAVDFFQNDITKIDIVLSFIAMFVIFGLVNSIIKGKDFL